jgi:hypothetical protein
MATYDEFESLVGMLKRNSVDAIVFNNGWMIDGDSYRDLTGNEVTRPGVDGQGGCKVRNYSLLNDNLLGSTTTGPGPARMEEQFAGIRDSVNSAVDSIVAPWRGLPDPAAIDGVVEQCRTASADMGVVGSKTDSSDADGGGSNGSVQAQGTGRIFGDLSFIDQEIQRTGMTGETVTAFQMDILYRARTLILGFHSISVVCGVAAAAESVLWRKARQRVADVLAWTCGANIGVLCRGVPPRESLKIAGWVAEAVAEFSGGPVSVAAKVLGGGIEALSEFGSEDIFVTYQYLTAEDSLRSLQNSLNVLNGEIRAAEVAIEANLKRNFNNVKKDFSKDDLHRSFDVKLKAMRIDTDTLIANPAEARNIAGVPMTRVRQDCEVIAKDVRACSFGATLARADAIGMAPSGPVDAFYALVWLNYELVTDLAWEIEAGAKNLKAVVDCFENRDSDNAVILARLGKAAEVGSGIDFWNAPGKK